MYRLKSLFTLLLLVAASLVYGQNTGLTNSELMEKGNLAFNEGRFEDAIGYFSKLVESNADDVEASNRIGQCQYMMGEFDKAIHTYNALIKKHSLIPTLYVSRGFVYSGISKTWKAIADFSRAIELEPDNPDFHYNRGCAYDDLEIYDMAVLNYSKAIEMFPKDADYFYNRAFALEQLGKYPEAELDYSAVIQMTQDDAEAYLSRAIVYLLMDDHESAACMDLEAASNLDDERAKILYTVQCEEDE